MATNKNFEIKNGLTIAGTERISSAGAFTGSLASATTATTQSAADSSTKIATTAYTDAAITAVIGGAPGTLDTLNELAAAINDDASYASTLTTALATKAPLASPTFTGTITGTLATAAQPNITSVGSLTALDVAGTPTFDGLTVAGNAYVGAGNYFTDSTSGYFFGGGGSFTNGVYGVGTNNMAFNVNSSERMRINSSGNVGIGTASPTEMLHINKTSGTGSFIRFQDTGGSGVYIGGRAEVMEMYTNGSEKMRIDSAGNVGISNSAPSVELALGSGGGEKLHVYHGGSVKAGFGVDLSGSSRELSMFHSTTGTNGNISFGKRLESNGAYTESLRIHGNGAFTAKKGMIVTTNAAEVSNTGYTQYNSGAWINSPANTYGYLATGGGGVLRWALSEVYIAGALSKSSGSFRIPHPVPSKTDTHDLVHSFVEAPQADNIYRGVVDLVDGTASINIDTVSGMTEGTYVLLNTNTSCFTSNETDWDAVKGSVSGNILTISCQNSSSTATVSWLVIGERHDQHMKDTNWTDENGRVIVEPLKTEETPQVNLENA